MLTISLRKFTPEEYHRFFRGYVQDPVMSPEPFRYDREMIDRSYRYNYEFRDHFALYGVFLGDEPVGSFQLKRMDPGTGQCEFGIILQNDGFKNRGIGTEAVRQGLLIARQVYHMRLVQADTSGRNVRMRRVFEKLGFTLAETVPGQIECPDGTLADRLVYEIHLEEKEG